MPDTVQSKKISQLPNATTLDGTESLVGIQGGATKQVTSQQIATLIQAPLNEAVSEAQASATAAAGSATEAQETIDTFNSDGIDSHLIHYSSGSVKDALDKLLYAGLKISSMTINPTQAELGSTVSQVVVSWVISGTPNTQSLNGASIAYTDRSETFSNVNSTTAYNLAIADTAAPGGTASANASVTISFLSKGYWGVLDTQTPTDAQLLTLSQALQTTRPRAVTYNASAGGYPIYAWPASQGALTGAQVGGLGFSSYTVTTRNVVNASGTSVSYNIAVFNTRQTGASIGVNWL